MSPRQQRLVECLTARQGELVTYDEIARHIWPARCPDCGPRLIAHQMLNFLRRQAPDLRRRIVATRGVGLRIVDN